MKSAATSGEKGPASSHAKTIVNGGVARVPSVARLGRLIGLVPALTCRATIVPPCGLEKIGADMQSAHPKSASNCGTRTRGTRHLVVSQFEIGDLFGIAFRAVALEPSGAAKWTMTGKIRNGWQKTTLNVRSLLHPRWVIWNVLTNLRPAAREMPCLDLP